MFALGSLESEADDCAVLRVDRVRQLTRAHERHLQFVNECTLDLPHLHRETGHFVGNETMGVVFLRPEDFEAVGRLERDRASGWLALPPARSGWISTMETAAAAGHVGAGHADRKLDPECFLVAAAGIEPDDQTLPHDLG